MLSTTTIRIERAIDAIGSAPAVRHYKGLEVGAECEELPILAGTALVIELDAGQLLEIVDASTGHRMAVQGPSGD